MQEERSMHSDVCVVIPVRLQSERFPNKPLCLYKGKTLIHNVIEIATKLHFVDRIVVACSEDSREVQLICEEYQIDFLHVAENVSCGTEKVYYVHQLFPMHSYYMTIPVDEPSLDPAELNHVFSNYCDKPFTIATLFTEFFCEEDLLDEKSCKIVTFANSWKILYTSRAVIPAKKDGTLHELCFYKKHVGVFLFPAITANTKQFWHKTLLSSLEGLEQNMFLEYNFQGFKINHKGFGIDVKEQISRLEERMSH